MKIFRNTAISLIRNGRRFLSPISADETNLSKWIGMKCSNEKWYGEYKTLSVSKDENGIFDLKFHRPEKLNAFNIKMWEEMEHFFQGIELDKSARVVILSGEGKAFTTGMDLNVFDALENVAKQEKCEGRKREILINIIQRLQNVISLPEVCRIPVIAAVHGMCLGGGVDLITSCDLRYCDKSAEFSVKEIDLGIVADIGTLQRLPLIVGDQRAKELAFTGRHFTGEEAQTMGLVLECYEKGELTEKVENVASMIAKQSPLTIRGIKKSLNYKKNHSVEDSLHQVRHWNGAMLMSEDLTEAFVAKLTKKKPQFKD